MAGLSRFTVSIETELLNRYLKLSKRQGAKNRSEAIRNLMREALVREEWTGDAEIVGTVTIVYDHHKRELMDRLTNIQHDHHDAIMAATHVHLDHHNCLEVIAVKGRARDVQKLSDLIINTKGVKHGKLSATTTGRKLR